MPMATAVGDAVDFEAPQFGITVLGAADGFTAAGTAAGAVNEFLLHPALSNDSVDDE